jgi:small subunit ribosomal protein S8
LKPPKYQYKKNKNHCFKMAVTDPIADFLTRIRNAQMAGHSIVEIPSSNMKKRITEILYDQGYILKYKFDAEAGKAGLIKIALKYDAQTKEPVIRSLVRVSRPGLRQYRKTTDIPRVINGLGIAIVSTSRGVMTDKDARKQNVGGELLCYIY